MSVLTTQIALIMTCVATEVNAIEGVRKAELIINGQSYVFPIGDNEGRERDIYYLKRWLQESDETALDMFMGTEDEKHLFIGDDTVVWALVSKSGQVTVKQP